MRTKHKDEHCYDHRWKYAYDEEITHWMPLPDGRMTNKEVIAKLKKYFLTQNPEIVAYLAACLMIDIDRFMNLDNLDWEECQCLFDRSRKNIDQLNQFLKDGSLDNIVIILQKRAGNTSV